MRINNRQARRIARLKGKRLEQALSRATAQQFIEELNSQEDRKQNEAGALSLESRQRLVRLVELCRLATTSRLSHKKASADIVEQANELFLPYVASPSLRAVPGIAAIQAWTCESGSTLEERYATQIAFWIRDRVADGSISRVRRCLECSRWLWAVRSRKQYCKGKCRQAHFTRSEDYRKRRSRYMQKYRRDRRERDEKIKQIARRIR
jgi:hypothetical protein